MISIYGLPLFAAAFGASQFAPSRLLEVWGLLFAGVALGVALSVVVHPGLGGGERNLWPFEVVMFWIVGLVPAWLGLFAGRFLAIQRGRYSPSNNRWRVP
jgi:hypothetical protein